MKVQDDKLAAIKAATSLLIHRVGGAEAAAMVCRASVQVLYEYASPHRPGLRFVRSGWWGGSRHHRKRWSVSVWPAQSWRGRGPWLGSSRKLAAGRRVCAGGAF